MSDLNKGFLEADSNLKEGIDMSESKIISESFDDFGKASVESPFGNWVNLFPKEKAIPDEEILDAVAVSVEY